MQLQLLRLQLWQPTPYRNKSKIFQDHVSKISQIEQAEFDWKKMGARNKERKENCIAIQVKTFPFSRSENKRNCLFLFDFFVKQQSAAACSSITCNILPFKTKNVYMT